MHHNIIQHLAVQRIGPYNFKNLKENKKFLEKDLEQGLIDNLQEFPLELGKDFYY